jgi:hypothetical protein
LAEILKEAAGIRDSDPASDALARIRSLGEELLTPSVTDDPERTIAILAHTMGVTDPDHSYGDLDPREIKARTNSAWRSLFSALSSQAPVVIIVEDIHWADPALLDILEDMTEKVAGPLMLVCPARPELTERRAGWGGGRRNHSSIFLDPLTPEDSDTLVSLLLTVANLPSRLRLTIMETAEGNPFFLEEVVRHLIDQGHLIREGDTWVAGDDLAAVEIPDSVQSVLAARIDLLDPSEKRVLQRAAVVGRIFWPTPVVRLLGGDKASVGPLLDHLEERELIQSRLGSSLVGEPEYIFKHVLTREVAYEMLPRRERGAAHADVAAWIEESTGDRAGELVELVAHHWMEAHQAAEDDLARSPSEIDELRRRALASTLEASRASRSRAAVARARKLADQALSLAREPLELASAMNVRGLAALSDYDGDVAWSSLKEEVDRLLAESPSEHALIAHAAARAVETPTRWPGSMNTPLSAGELTTYLDIGFAHLDPEDKGEDMIRLLIARAMVPYSRTHHDFEFGDLDLDAAREDGERAFTYATALGRLDLASAALDAVGSVEQDRGDFQSHTEVLARRLPLIEEMANPWEIGDTLAMASFNASYIGDYRKGRELGEKGVALIGGDAVGLILHNTVWISYAEFWLGNWDRVINELASQARSILGDRVTDPPYFATHQFGAETFIRTVRGDPDLEMSRSVLSRLVERSDTAGQGATAAQGWAAWLMAREGQVSEAIDVLDRMTSRPQLRPFVDIVRTTVMLDGGFYSDFQRFVDESREYAAWAGIDALQPHHDRLEGGKAFVDGDLETAIVKFDAARQAFERLGTPFEIARTDLWLADAHLSAGDPEAATSAIESARPVLEGLGSIPEIERARSLLLRL